jgi:hypothetical protein
LPIEICKTVVLPEALMYFPETGAAVADIGMRRIRSKAMRTVLYNSNVHVFLSCILVLFARVIWVWPVGIYSTISYCNDSVFQ